MDNCEIWTINKMITMGIVTKFQGHLVPYQIEYDVVADCMVRAWKKRSINADFGYFETVRYVYTKDEDGVVGYATSQMSYDLHPTDWHDQVKFQVLQSIEAPR